MPLDNYSPRPGLPGSRSPGMAESEIPPTPGPRQPTQPGVITPTPSPGGKFPIQPPDSGLYPQPTQPVPIVTPTPSPGGKFPGTYPPTMTGQPVTTNPINAGGPTMTTQPVPGTTAPVTQPAPNTGGPNMGIPGGPGSGQTPVPQPTTPMVPPSLANYLPPGHQFSAGQVVGNSLDNLLSSDSRYIQNARQRGREEAANRGLLNSSIAAGSAERAGIEASMPILDQIMGLHRQREGEAFQSTEAQRDRLFQSEFSLLNANVQDWLNNNQYNREFNGQLAMLPIASSAQMWSGLLQLAATDPTVFTPDVLAGYQDFFQSGFQEYISRYLQPPANPGTGG